MAILRQYIAPILAIIILVIVVISWLLYEDKPVIIEDSVGEASVLIEAEQDHIFLPGDCINVRWELDGIQAVFASYGITQLGSTGYNKSPFCIWNDDPLLIIDFTEDLSTDYIVPVKRLYNNPFVLMILLSALVSLCYLAFRLFGIPAVLSILTFVCFMAPVSVNTLDALDFNSHLFFIENAKWSKDFSNLPPHSLYHRVTLLLDEAISTLSLRRASYWLMMIAQVGTALGLYRLFTILDERSKTSMPLQILYATLALGLLVAGPLAFLLDDQMLTPASAYLYANTYHSPTMYLMRLFGIWLFVSLISVPIKWSRSIIFHVIAVSILTVLATYSKPNYTLVIVPGYLVLILYLYMRDRYISINKLVVASVLTGTAMLALLQLYVTTYSSTSANVIASENSEIIFRWLGVYPIWNISPQVVIMSWGVSLIFPITVALLYFFKIWDDDALVLSWITLLGGLAIAILFVETPRIADGNFIWQTQITTLIVFATSVSFLIRQSKAWHQARFDWRLWLCGLLLAGHIINHSYILYNHYF